VAAVGGGAAVRAGHCAPLRLGLLALSAVAAAGPLCGPGPHSALAGATDSPPSCRSRPRRQATAGATGFLAAQLSRRLHVARDPGWRPSAQWLTRSCGCTGRRSRSTSARAPSGPGLLHDRLVTCDRAARPLRGAWAEDGIAFERGESRAPGAGRGRRLALRRGVVDRVMASRPVPGLAATVQSHMDRGWLQDEVTRIVRRGVRTARVGHHVARAGTDLLLLVVSRSQAGDDVRDSGTGDDVSLRRLEFAPVTAAAACSAVAPRADGTGGR
jgi:hypothetical protein